MSHADDEQLRQQATLPPATGAGEASDAPSDASSLAAIGSWELDARPESISRFKVVATLGSGGYGVVYKAHDPELRRDVAIKVPHRHCVAKPQDAQAYLAEAQILASLDHPHIVPVYDVGRTVDGLCYVVSKFIEGGSLAQRVQQSRPGHAESADLVAAVAEALHYAHRKGLVHRDIKPGNILLDPAGNPCVVDFGLALREEEFGKGAQSAGTPAYMSPEQARGEGHRVDGRSDIFSLGVVFYELLTGRRPFRGDTPLDVQIAIIEVEPRPPRQLDDSIPKELERICLKALAKRASERYTTARDIAEDLRHFLASPESREQSDRVLANAATVAEFARLQAAAAGSLVDPGSPLSPVPAIAGATPAQTPVAAGPITPAPPTPSDSLPIKIVPRGLRSFDAHDADFFLELLPGPRDREGLPESIRFWKTRIEETDADATFSVGLLYGPSGCGKLSLVKAGLLPRLAKSVISIYIEATREDTEARLLKGLRMFVVPPSGGASQSAGDLNPPEGGTTNLAEFLATLRRGHGMPADKKVLIVLDQFEQWLHVHGDDSEPSDLLAALRQADGRRVQFLLLVRDDFWLAVARLFLALEIAMLDGQNQRLVDLFDPRHARRVLQLFGQAYGCVPERSSEFSAEQNTFLDQVVDGLSENGKVISVRLSLVADMMKGRPWTPAELKAVGGTEGVGVTFLEETLSARTASPEHRLLEKPARAVLAALLPEAGTDIKGRMRSRAELLQASGLAAHPQRFDRLLQILDSELRIITPTEAEQSEISDLKSDISDYYQLTHDYLVPPLRQWLTQKQRETWRGRAELRLAERATQWTRHRENRYLPSLTEYVRIVCGVPRRKRTADQQRLVSAATRYHGARWGSVLVALILAGVLIQQYAQSVRRTADQRRAESLVEAVLSAPPAGVPYTIKNLEPLRELAVPRLRQRLEDDSAEPGHRLHAALALAAFSNSRSPAGERNPSGSLSPVGDGNPSGSLSPAGERNPSGSLSPAGERVGVRGLPADIVALLLDAIEAGPAGECANILTALKPVKDSVTRQLMERGAAQQDPAARMRLACTLLQLGEPQASADMLERGPDPTYRTAFIHGFDSWHSDLSRVPAALESTLQRASADEGPDTLKRELQRHSAFRSGVCAALGLIPRESINAEQRQALQHVLQKLYREAPDGATHSAAGWALRQWKVELPPVEPSQGPRGMPPSPQPSPPRGEGAGIPSPPAAGGEGRVRGPGAWFVNRHAMTMIEIPPGTCTMGDEQDQNNKPHQVTLTRGFFMADREVWLDLFQQFLDDKDYPAAEKPQNWQRRDYAQQVSPTGDCPAMMVSWFDAVLFSNWLSQKEGRPPCYKRTGEKQKGPYKDQQGKDIEWDVWSCDFAASGYRLPTEAEWEYACRAETRSAFCFGSDESLLPKYGFFYGNSKQRAWPGGTLLPNGWGLFDLHGNLWEWCWDWHGELQGDEQDPTGSSAGVSRVIRGGDWYGYPSRCRSSFRNDYQPGDRLLIYGFRVVCGAGGGVRAE